MDSEKTSGRLLYLLKSRGPQSVSSTAEALALSPMAARQQLENLVGRGLAEHYDQRAGVGRPSRHWQLTEAGHARFPDRHGELTARLVEDVRSLFGEAGLEQLIAKREAESLALYRERTVAMAELGDKVQALAGQRSREGYMAETQALDDGSWQLIENHCPICVAARSCQNFCRSELAIFREILGPEVSVERTDHILAGARRCAYRISPKVIP